MNEIEKAIVTIKCLSLKSNINTPELMKHMDLAISALEKQIPKKPIESTRAIKAGIEGANCSSCGGLIFSSESYCKRCGQKLDWSEVE